MLYFYICSILNPILAKLPLAGDLNVKDVIESGSKNSTALNGLNDQVDQFGGGAFNILQKFSIYSLVIAVILGGLALVFSNAGNRSDAKSKILYVIIGGAIVFGAVGIVGLLQQVGGTMFNNVN